MADAKITALTENTTPIGTDLLAIVDDPAGTPVTQKVTLANIDTLLSATTKTLTNKTLTSPKINEDVALTATATQLNAVGSGGVTTRLLSKVIAITRDAAGVAGDVSYTGVGFQPTSMQVIMNVTATTYMSIMLADSARTVKGYYVSANNVYRTLAGYIVAYSDASTWDQLGVLKSYDSDGFTITWSKTGTPTAGTLTCNVICYR